MSTRSLGDTTLLLLTDCLLREPLPNEAAISRQAAESLFGAVMRKP